MEAIYCLDLEFPFARTNLVNCVVKSVLLFLNLRIGLLGRPVRMKHDHFLIEVKYVVYHTPFVWENLSHLVELVFA